MREILYFDIVSDEGAGALYLVESDTGEKHFYYHYTSSDLENDKTASSSTNYSSFADFWPVFKRNNRWFTLHPLYIHPWHRPFIKEELGKVNWNVIADEKWRIMYQRQWNKVLNNPAEYYKPGNNG